eukprot:gene4016-3928_t
MPTIAIFFGIIVRMWHDDHPPPHIHLEKNTLNTLTFPLSAAPEIPQDKDNGQDYYASAAQTKALLRFGAQYRLQRIQAADMITTDEAATLSGTTRVTMNAWIKSGRCIGVSHLRRGYKLPRWQFEPFIFPVIAPMAAALASTDGWQLLAFLESPHPALDRQSPRTALEQGTPAQRLAPGQTFHRVQLTRARKTSVRINGLLLAPTGLQSGRFCLPSEATAYLADGEHTALYESIFRRDVHSRSLDDLARNNKLKMVVGSDNVFHDLGFAEPEAQNLLLRADLVSHIRKVILKLDITQAEAAQRAGISQPRMNDLVKGRTHKFTLDALVNVAAKLGYTVKLSLKRVA